MNYLRNTILSWFGLMAVHNCDGTGRWHIEKQPKRDFKVKDKPVYREIDLEQITKNFDEFGGAN